MRAVGAPFTVGIGAHPLIARLRRAGRAGQGRAGQGSWSFTAVLVREALPSLTVLSGRSAGGRSLERPCKWSAALSAVLGSGFRV